LIDQSKLKKLIVLAAVGGVLVVVLGVFLVNLLIQPKASETRTQNQTMTSQATSSSSNPPKSSADETPSSSDTTTQSENNDTTLENFFKSYQTQKLDKISLEQRQDSLKNEMTEKGFQVSHISDDTRALIPMVEQYQKTKTIDTSNSTQLIESDYISSKIYQQQNAGEGAYYVEVTFTERPIYQKVGTTMVARYNVFVLQGKVDNLSLIDQKPVSGGQN
jgi:lipopolysaccharide export LptBFGC system permease protein LptF